ncbi:TPA: ferredoxin [Candidatus Micrarchaeota archaeon]|nr:ferredoxin [Candidatus Micrarchaeota archaeon]
MGKIKIEFERDKCTGCEACTLVCPSNWEMKPDGKSMPKKLELDDTGENQDAEAGCPANCIRVTKL